MTFQFFIILCPDFPVSMYKEKTTYRSLTCGQADTKLHPCNYRFQCRHHPSFCKLLVSHYLGGDGFLLCGNYASLSTDIGTSEVVNSFFLMQVGGSSIAHGQERPTDFDNL